MAKSKHIAPRRARSPRTNRPDTWLVVWRVVAPAAPGNSSDITFAETPSEEGARALYGYLRRVGYPVRLERVSCDPLPRGAQAQRCELRSMYPENRSSEMPQIAGYCERRP